MCEGGRGGPQYTLTQTMINTAGLGVLPPAANVPLIGQGATLGHQRAGGGVPVTVAGAQVEAGSAGGGSGGRRLPAGGTR